MVEIVCLICYEEIDGKERYGYTACFDTHTFCKDCIVEMLKTDRRCPLDKRKNNTITMRKNDEEFILDEYYQLFFADDKGQPIDQRIKENRSTGKYQLNICLSCMNEVSDDTDMLWRRRCPEHHRICIDCFSMMYFIHKTCFIKHSACNINYANIESESDDYEDYEDYLNNGVNINSDDHQYTSEDNSNGQRIICKEGEKPYKFYCSRLCDTGPNIPVSETYIETLVYLKKEINSCIGDSADSAGKLQNMLEILRTTGEYRGNICMKCLHIIPGVSYGFKECHKSHVFCEECLDQMIQVAQVDQEDYRCSVCHFSTYIICIIEDGRVACEMRQEQLLFREYIRKMEVRNERAQQILTSMDRSPNCEADIPSDLCIGCFTVIKGRRHILSTNRNYSYCKQCVMEIGANKKEYIYCNLRWACLYIYTKKGKFHALYPHHYSILDFIESNGRSEESIRNTKSILWKFLYEYETVNCLKCGEGAADWEYGGTCPCGQLCCDACMIGTNWETVCPFSPQFRLIDAVK